MKNDPYTLEWKNSLYGSDISASLGAVGNITVIWSPLKSDHTAGTPYLITVFGRRLSKKFVDQEMAKEYAIKYAGVHIAHAAYKLGIMEDEEE